MICYYTLFQLSSLFVKHKNLLFWIALISIHFAKFELN